MALCTKRPHNTPLQQHHAEDDGKKPAKNPRIDPALAAPAPTTGATAPKAAAESHAVRNVFEQPRPAYAHEIPDMAAKRAAFGPCPLDIDTVDMNDPMFAAEYAQDVYDYLREKEVLDEIDPNYLSRQKNVAPRMRMVLVDWMVEVQIKFRLTSETLYLAVNIVDKFMERQEVTRDNMQLLGVTALFIASKFEEVFSVDLKDFVFICDDSCLAKDIINFEREVLRVIEWQLTTPCALHFLRRYSKAVGADGVHHTMSKYLIELALGSYTMLKYLPSMQAAAAVLLTRHFLGPAPCWTNVLEYHSGYKLDEILSCAQDMLLLVTKPDPKFTLVRRKYGGRKYCSVAKTAAEQAPHVKLV